MADIDIDAVERLLEGAAKASMAEKETKSAPAPAAVAGPAPAPASSAPKTEEKKDEKDDKKDRENGHSRSRDRDREDKDRDRRHRSRSRSPHRDRRDRDRDYDRSRDRRRSGDKDYDRRDRDRDYDRRDRDYDRRDRSRRDDRDRDRDHRRDDRSRGDAKPKEVDRPHIIGDSPPRRKEEPKGPSIDNDDRDERTVFVQNMPSKATDKEIKEFFAQAGKVTEIRMITDKYSGKSKGFGYIEFESKQSIELALLLSGATVRGQPVIVQQSQAEKNRAAAQAAATAAAAAKDERRDKPVKIYVGNLPENTTEELLRKAFAKFGEIDSIQFHTEDDGRCKGYSFLTFRKPEDAKRCMKTGGVQILGKEVEIAGSHDAPVTAHKPANQGMFGELDDEGGGLTLNAKARVSLMKRLQRDEPAPPPKPAAPVPTPCVMLSNMFDPAEETNPNFHLEIQEDVQGECARFGQVLHIFVDPHSKGTVYVKFATAEAATAAFNALKGRFFSGRMIAAEYMEPRAYTAKFPGN